MARNEYCKLKPGGVVSDLFKKLVLDTPVGFLYLAAPNSGFEKIIYALTTGQDIQITVIPPSPSPVD